jgi:hypothetical protein
MKFKLSLIIFFFVSIVLYIIINRNEADYVTSTLNGKKYVVRNMSDKNDAANLLAFLDNNITIFSDSLYKRKDEEKMKENKTYIELLYNRSKNVKLSEGGDNSSYTTYTINKGEKIVFCLRSKATKKLHDHNLLMFVTIHELAHIACPEKDHTPLFVSIFKFLLKQAIDLNIYIYTDYKKNEIEYCGMMLNQTPI